MRILIDTEGKAWDESSGSLRQHFQAPISSKALPDYLVRNMGFIALKITGDTALIRGTPAIMSYKAFSIAVEMLDEVSIRRMALKWFDGRWHDEVYFGDGTRSARKRLLELMLKHRRRPSQYYLSFPRELESITSDHYSRLLEFWRGTQGRIDPETHQEQLYNITDGKFLTVMQRDNGQLAFSSIGKGLTVYRDNSWAAQFSGGPVENQPDYNYGQWIVSGYREAFANKTPNVSDFDAVVHDARNGNSQHHRYTRLLLPIVTRDGKTQLLSAPRADTSIDLGLKAEKEIR